MKHSLLLHYFSINLFLIILPIKATNFISDVNINEIYFNFVKPNYTDEYKNRYVPLPLYKNNLPWRWEGKDLPRVIALLEFERFISTHNIRSTKGLAINGLDPEWHCLPCETIFQTDYETNPEAYDLHTLNLPDKDFDFVMVNQTLEHVYDPIRCLENIFNHMAPGGILYLNVPANNIPHSTPFHYYTGFTPVGLGAVVQSAGFKILSIGQWGNFEYLNKMFATKSWPDYRQFTNPGLNDINCPCITWIFAMK